jgi:hypothetical protein
MNVQSFIRRGFTRIKRATEQIQTAITPSPIVVAHRMSDEVFLGLFNIETVSNCLAQGDVRGAKRALVDHYAHRSWPTWPAPPKNLTDLRLDLGKLTLAALVDRANAVLHFHLMADKAKPQVTAQGQIDWTHNPTSDKAWLWRLNRHQWWVILGLAYKQTGDERYAAAFVEQMLDWTHKNPPLQDKNEQSPTWRLMEIGLRLRISWIPAFALFYESATFTDEAKLVMCRAIYDQARFLSLFKTNRNHLLRESNGLAYAAVYFPEFQEAAAWRHTALERIAQELPKQINQDGSQIEVSTGYQWLVIDELEATYRLLRDNNLSLPNQNLAEWLKKMYQLLAYVVRPDGTFPEINDGFILWRASRLASAGEMLGRDDFTYIGTRGAQGTPPENTSLAFSDAGLFVMRSDWTEDARYLLFDCGPFGGPHGHEDKLSIEVFAYGQPFVVDSGSYTYDKRDPFRTYFVGSQGHNTVLVDYQSQIRRWQKEHLHPKTAEGNFATWISRPEFDYVASTYGEGYSHYSMDKPDDQKINNDVVHTRHVLFVKPDYWLIVDDLQTVDCHDYQLLFHTPPGVMAKVEGINCVVLDRETEASGLYLLPAYPADLTVTCATGSEDPIQGWYSLDHRHKTASTAVIFEQKNVASTVFVTLLYPYPSRKGADAVGIEPLHVVGGNAVAFLVTTPRGQDHLLISRGEGVKQFGPYRSSGLVAGIRLDHNGNMVNRFEG